VNQKSPRPGVARDPLDAVPVVPAGLTRTRVPGGLLLARRLPPEGRLGVAVERWLRVSRDRRYALDRLGAEFFAAIDGERSLAAIARKLSASLGVEEGEAQSAVKAFTKALVERGLLLLRLEPGGPPSRSRSPEA
jgi:hypothetical protein